MSRHAAGPRWLLLAALLFLSECGADNISLSILRRVIREELTGALNEHGCQFQPPVKQQATPTVPPEWPRETQPSASVCGCPEEFVACSGRCYLPLTTAVTHEQATAHCAQLGARLAVPRTLKENMCAAGLAGQRRVWLGITDLAVEGEFVDQDGRPVAEELGNVWSEGQPDNFQGNEGCVEIWPAYAIPNGRFAAWNDRDCRGKALPMCQLD